MAFVSLTPVELKWIKRAILLSFLIYIVFYIVWKFVFTTEEQKDQPKTLKVFDFKIPINGIGSYGFGRGKKEWINWIGCVTSCLSLCLMCILLVHYSFTTCKSDNS